MEVMAMEIEGVHLGVGNFDALRIGVDVEFAAYGQAGVGVGGSDQLDDGLVAEQRPAAPVLSDEREETMFDLVPFAGSGRQMADGDLDVEFIGQGLEFELPQAYARAIAAAAVCGDHQLPGLGIALTPHDLPPTADRIDREA